MRIIYNIVIADDEQLERMALRQILEEYLQSKCIIKTASNGREAVEYALLIKADIVFMDIEMPIIGGLDASRLIIEKLPKCKIIILTAYSEFSYARESIEFGAVDYLLKPCADEEIYTVVNRTTSIIDQEREKEKEKELSAYKIQNLTTQIEEQLVLTIMGGYINPQYILERLNELDIEFCNGVFAILYNPARTEDMISIIKSSIWPKYINPIVYMYDGRLYMLSISSNNNTDCAAETNNHLKRLSDAAKTLFGSPLYGAIGSKFEQIEDAQNSCFQAQIAIERCTDENPIYCFKEKADETKGDPLLDSILMGEKEKINKIVCSIIKNLDAMQLDWAATVTQLESLIAKVIQRIQLGLGIALPKIDLGSCEKNDIDSLCRITSELLVKISSKVTEEMEMQQDIHLSEVKKSIQGYVTEHYHEDISLPEIANKMHYSNTYFSKLFKQCFRTNFIIYLTDVRINAAKDLLCSTNLTIKEVGENVGYSDPNYFTKVFRKVTGKSPSEYKASVGSASADGGRYE